MTRNASGNPVDIKSDLSRYLDAIVVTFDDPDDEDDDDSGAGGSGAEDEDEGEGGEAGAGASGSTSGDVKDPDKKRLSDEAAASRVRAKTAERLLAERDAELRKLQDKDKSELELAKRNEAEAVQRAEAAETRLLTQTVELAFFKSGQASLFHDPTDVLPSLTDIKPDDEGNVDIDEVKKRCDELLKKKPYLARRDGSDDGDDDKPGQTPANGRRKKTDEATSKKMLEKFPALASRA